VLFLGVEMVGLVEGRFRRVEWLTGIFDGWAELGFCELRS